MPRGVQLKSDRTAVPALRLAILFIYPLLWSYTPAQAATLSGGGPADNAGETGGSEDSGPHKAVEAEKEDDAVVAEGAAKMSYLVAVMEEVAESVKAEFKDHPADADPQQRGLFENQYDFVEFRTRFREKFVQRLKQNEEARSRETLENGLEQKDILDNAARNVTDFLGQNNYIKPEAFENYFRFERPAALLAIPLRIVKELWREEIPKRRKAWEDEGKMLFVAEADKNLTFVELYAERRNSVEVDPFLQDWVRNYPRYPGYLQEIEEEREAKDHLNWLAQHYTKPGGGSQWKRVVWGDGWVGLSAVDEDEPTARRRQRYYPWGRF